jgi:hypothetical protein
VSVVIQQFVAKVKPTAGHAFVSEHPDKAPGLAASHAIGNIHDLLALRVQVLPADVHDVPPREPFREIGGVRLDSG